MPTLTVVWLFNLMLLIALVALGPRGLQRLGAQIVEQGEPPMSTWMASGAEAAVVASLAPFHAIGFAGTALKNMLIVEEKEMARVVRSNFLLRTVSRLFSLLGNVATIGDGNAGSPPAPPPIATPDISNDHDIDSDTANSVSAFITSLLRGRVGDVLFGTLVIVVSVALATSKREPSAATVGGIPLVSEANQTTTTATELASRPPSGSLGSSGAVFVAGVGPSLPSSSSSRSNVAVTNDHHQDGANNLRETPTEEEAPSSRRRDSCDARTCAGVEAPPATGDNGGGIPVGSAADHQPPDPARTPIADGGATPKDNGALSSPSTPSDQTRPCENDDVVAASHRRVVPLQDAASHGRVVPLQDAASLPPRCHDDQESGASSTTTTSTTTTTTATATATPPHSVTHSRHDDISPRSSANVTPLDSRTATPPSPVMDAPRNGGGDGDHGDDDNDDDATSPPLEGEADRDAKDPDAPADDEEEPIASPRFVSALPDVSAAEERGATGAMHPIGRGQSPAVAAEFLARSPPLSSEKDDPSRFVPVSSPLSCPPLPTPTMEAPLPPQPSAALPQHSLTGDTIGSSLRFGAAEKERFERRFHDCANLLASPRTNAKFGPLACQLELVDRARQILLMSPARDDLILTLLTLA